jgi:hypothetical protein
VALDTEHLTVRAEGLEVLVASSKTDQEGQGQLVAIPRVDISPYCPVQAVSDWLVAAGISSGAVFRSMHRGDTVGSGTDENAVMNFARARNLTPLGAAIPWK